MRKNYYIKTFGCQMNYSDSERFATIVEGIGPMGWGRGHFGLVQPLERLSKDLLEAPGKLLRFSSRIWTSVETAAKAIKWRWVFHTPSEAGAPYGGRRTLFSAFTFQ